MTSFKLLLFCSCFLLAPAARALAQDAIYLDDDALLNRVTKEIDALTQAAEQANAEKKALDENGMGLAEAQHTASAPLASEPDGIAELEWLDQQSLVEQVRLREEYLAAYDKRKQAHDQIPSLIDTRRKRITQAIESFSIAEQQAGDLRPPLAGPTRLRDPSRTSGA